MSNKIFSNKIWCVMLITFILSFQTSGGDLEHTLYGGFGNTNSSDTTIPLVFRGFQAWNNYLDLNWLSDTRDLPEITAFSDDWRNDSTHFENSIAVAFEGNRIAKIINAALIGEKIIITYELSDKEYTIIHYQFDPQGQEIAATATVTFFITGENLKEREVVFTQNSSPVKRPQPGFPNRTSLNRRNDIRNIGLRGNVVAGSNACGIYISRNVDGYIIRKAILK